MPRRQPAPAVAPVPTGPRPDPDQARRLDLTRLLMRSAVRHYHETLAFTREVEAAKEECHERVRMTEEYGEWKIIAWQADTAFVSAEVELAAKIQNLYNMLAPAPSRMPDDMAGTEFLERAITIDGTTYVLVYDPGDYDEGTNIVAFVPANRVISLDG
jgi:hypothetical protein